MQEIQPTAPREEAASSLPAFVCVAGGIMAALGSFLPWVKVSADMSQLGGGQFSETVNGLDGDGVITLVAGIVLIAVGVLLMVLKGRGALALGIVGIIGGIVAAGTSIYDIFTIKTTTTSDLADAASRNAGVSVDQARQIIDRFLKFDISLQLGVVIVAIGGIVGLVGGILALARRSRSLSATVVADGSAVGVPPVAPPPPPASAASPAAEPSGGEARPLAQPPSPPVADEGVPPPV